MRDADGMKRYVVAVTERRVRVYSVRAVSKNDAYNRVKSHQGKLIPHPGAFMTPVIKMESRRLTDDVVIAEVADEVELANAAAMKIGGVG